MASEAFGRSEGVVSSFLLAFLFVSLRFSLFRKSGTARIILYQSGCHNFVYESLLRTFSSTILFGRLFARPRNFMSPDS